jgi:heptosyltransferase-2
MSDRYAALADKIIEKYDANVVVSVAPNKLERRIAAKICSRASHELFNLGDLRLDLGELKGLFSKADVVITNDTGGRHIAIALRKKVITLFGPNNPKWTRTGYADEIQICGTGECVPCDRPKCKMSRHICMESISVDEVFQAAEKMLDSQGS